MLLQQTQPLSLELLLLLNLGDQILIGELQHGQLVLFHVEADGVDGVGQCCSDDLREPEQAHDQVIHKDSPEVPDVFHLGRTSLDLSIVLPVDADAQIDCEREDDASLQHDEDEGAGDHVPVLLDVEEHYPEGDADDEDEVGKVDDYEQVVEERQVFYVTGVQDIGLVKEAA